MFLAAAIARNRRARALGGRRRVVQDGHYFSRAPNLSSNGKKLKGFSGLNLI